MCPLKAMFRAIYLSVVFVPIVASSASAWRYGYDDAEWCLSHATKRIKDQSMKNTYCPQYVVGWGLHHQRSLARDAVNAVYCENNIDRAIDYLRVCQCHNKGMHDAMVGHRGAIREWAMLRAPQIGIQCPIPAPSPPSPPPMTQTQNQAVAVLVVECINRASSSFNNPSTGRSEVIGSGQDCQSAKQNALMQVGGNFDAFCARQNGNYNWTSTGETSWRATGTCR